MEGDSTVPLQNIHLHRKSTASHGPTICACLSLAWESQQLHTSSGIFQQHTKTKSGSRVVPFSTQPGTANAQDGFYFTDERLSDGSPVQSQMDAQARAQLHWTLTESPEQGPFYFTYVKHKGYVDFQDLYGRATKS